MSRFDIRTRKGLISSIIQGEMGSSADADAQAFFDRVTVAGGTLTLTEKNAVNTLVLSLKANSIWTSMTAIYPMVGASAAACAQNLKSSSYTGTFSGGWTYASAGVTPNGTNAYMDTNLNSLSVLSISNLHLSIYSRTTNASLFDIGVSSGNSNQGLFLTAGFLDNKSYYQNGSSQISAFIANNLGLYVGTSQSTSSQKIYKNGGIIVLGSVSTTTSLVNANIYLSALNTIGTAGNYSSRQNAFASIGLGLSDTDTANFYTTVQTFQTTLSRQV